MTIVVSEAVAELADALRFYVLRHKLLRVVSQRAEPQDWWFEPTRLH